MSKGSQRRPATVTRETMADAWARTFAKPPTPDELEAWMEAEEAAALERAKAGQP